MSVDLKKTLNSLYCYDLNGPIHLLTLPLYHFYKDRVAVPLPRHRLSDASTHAAAVVLRGPFETLTSVHSPAVQGTAH